MSETGGVRRDDPSTSYEAAERVDVRKGWIDILGVLATISRPRGDYPMCMVEIHNYLRETSPHIDMITSRPHELVERGYIAHVGDLPRANRSGNLRNQMCYVITKQGLEFWQAFTVLRPFRNFTPR